MSIISRNSIKGKSASWQPAAYDQKALARHPIGGQVWAFHHHRSETRHTLKREASGQVIEYYCLLKEQFLEKSIELILCANTIPNERKTFFENVGIDCKEIPFSEFVNIADRYRYTFLDTKKHESEDLDLLVISPTFR